jgi:hypothetical protein
MAAFLFIVSSFRLNYFLSHQRVTEGLKKTFRAIIYPDKCSNNFFELIVKARIRAN